MEIVNTSPAFTAIQELISDRKRQLEQLRSRKQSLGVTNRDQWLNRAPMIITSENWVTGDTGVSGRYIILWANPSNVQWNFKLRGVEQQTRTGYVQHYWKDSARSTFFDNPELSITFQTGNVLPVRVYQSIWEGSGKIAYLPPGLLDYYDFFDLLDEKKILSDGRPNYTYIVYRSLLYPLITLRGYFKRDAGINITDDAENPGGFTWTTVFRVQASNPPFYKGNALASAWNSQFNSNQVEDTSSSASITGLDLENL